MRGYWFNQNYGYLTAATTVKFNRKYIGIPFKQKFPGLSKQYNIRGTFSDYKKQSATLLNEKYTITGMFRYIIPPQYPLLNAQYTFTGKFSDYKKQSAPLLNTQYTIKGRFNTIESE